MIAGKAKGNDCITIELSDSVKILAMGVMDDIVQ